jgi:hypothetical protein
LLIQQSYNIKHTNPNSNGFGGENLGSLRLNRTFMTRSIQLRDIKRTVGVTPWTKERLSQESLNSRTREYILVRQSGQLFFDRANGQWLIRLVTVGK